MERPRMALTTKTTQSTSYETILDMLISTDALGISYFTLAIDPDPNARYRILIGKLMNVVELELTAVWQLSLPHLTQGIYDGFKAGDEILIQHKTTSAAIEVKTGATLEFNEVIT